MAAVARRLPRLAIVGRRLGAALPLRHGARLQLRRGTAGRHPSAFATPLPRKPIMKIIKPLTLSVLTRPFEFRREYWLGCAVLAFLPIGEDALLLPETELWPFAAEELPPDQPLDAAIPKAAPEFLAVAYGFAPGGVAASHLRTSIQLGPVTKSLDIFGDRVVDRSGERRSESVPFATMPIDWAHAYGGAGFADNPDGKGLTPLDGSEGRLFQAHNIVNPTLGAAGVRTPAGYGVVDQMRPARAKRAGTYDDAWLKQDFPGFARDIDWRFFNLAQPDQWLHQPLAGNETFACHNLHPEKPLLAGRLPGMAPRLFLVRNDIPDGDNFEEVRLSLTTVWLFPHRERLVLVHHGQARLAAEDASDIARVVVGADRLGAPRAAAEFHAVMVKRTEGKDRAPEALKDGDLVPPEWLPDKPPLAPPPEVSAAARLAAAIHRKMAPALAEAEAKQAEAGAALKARGLDPDKLLPPLPSLAWGTARPPPSLEDLPAMLDKVRADVAAAKQEILGRIEAQKIAVAAQFAASGKPMPDALKQFIQSPVPGLGDAKAKGPPKVNAAAMRQQLTAAAEKIEAEVAAAAASGKATGDLAAKSEAARSQLASPAVQSRLEIAQAAARNGYRLLAHKQDPADPVSAEQTAELRQLIAADTAAARALYDLHGADLSRMDLAGFDLSGVCLDGADLRGTSFAGAKLTDAVLAHAQMQNCVLDGAELSGANLGNAQLAGASLKQAILHKAVLAGADLSNASLAGASLEGADLANVKIDHTDFSNVHAPGILAMKVALAGMHAPGIVLTKAKFLECNLQGADLSGAMLERAVFLKCNLVGIRLQGARLRKAVFVSQCSLLGARLVGADLTEANLRDANVRGANLNRAILARADLSGADLSSALLNLVCANDSRLIAADLRRADLRLADFANADLSRADLRGANLTGMSVYQANLARTRLDQETRRGGMFRTRMRYLPVYQPPEDART